MSHRLLKLLFIQLVFQLNTVLLGVFLNAEESKFSSSSIPRGLQRLNLPCVSSRRRHCATSNDGVSREQPSGTKRSLAPKSSEEDQGSDEDGRDFHVREERLKFALRVLVQGLVHRAESLQNGESLCYEKSDFMDLGCIAMAAPDLDEFWGVVAMYPSAFLLRLSIETSSLTSRFNQTCNGHITPLAVNLHSKENTAIPETGTVNDGVCDRSNVGGIYDDSAADFPFSTSSEYRRLLQRSLHFYRSNDYDTNPSRGPGAQNNRASRAKCSPDVFEQRPFACRAGHFSGKFGLPPNVSASADAVDLRVVALDTHAENPCIIAHGGFPLVVSCAETGEAMACVPFHRLENLEPSAVIDDVLLLLDQAEASSAVVSTNKEMQALLSIISELEVRLQFLEGHVCSKD